MAKTASSERLKKATRSHLEETKQQVLLEETLDAVSKADQKLSAISPKEILPESPVKIRINLR